MTFKPPTIEGLMPEQDDRKRDELKERQKIVWQNMFYSIQRIDILIISVSGAGIYLCLEALKFMYQNKLPIHWALKWSAGFFVFAIVINFISQYLSYKTNYYDYLCCTINLKEKPTDEDLELECDYDSKSSLIDKWTDIANVASGIIMFAGLLMCSAYFIWGV